MRVSSSISQAVAAHPSLYVIGFERTLNRWVAEDPTPARKALSHYLLTWPQENTSLLDFHVWQVTSLPDVFDHPKFANVTSFEASAVGLLSLPQSIVELKKLQELWLSENPLEHLPEDIDQLSNLKTLLLNNTRLSTLPTTLRHLKSLTYLDLSENLFSQAFPESLCMLEQLEVLDISNNLLPLLPDAIGNLKNLAFLDVSDNLISEIPNTLCTMTSLNLLFLNDNTISALPKDLGLLTNLNTLCINNNQIVLLPDAIHNLSHLRLLEADQVNVDLQEHLIKTYAYAQQEYHVLTRLLLNTSKKQQMLLVTWLEKLSTTAPGKSNHQPFYLSIIKLLELANTDEQFRPVFLHALPDTEFICGDRVALSILNLDIQRQLLAINPLHHQQLAEFLKRGVWAISLLEHCALNKVLCLRQEIRDKTELLEWQKTEAIEEIEEVEIYLGYPIKLKKILKLPIAMDEMIYFSFSQLTDRNLKEAQDFVLEHIEKQDLFKDFLITQDEWLNTLKIKYPQQFASIRAAYEDADAEIDDPALVYQEALKELTMKLLDTPEPSAAAYKKLRVGRKELHNLGISIDSLKAEQDLLPTKMILRKA